VGPALALCYLVPLCTAPDRRARLRAAGRIALGAGIAVLPPLLCGLPFWGFAGLVRGLSEKYLTTASSYPYATINAANLMAFWGGEWIPQTNRLTLQLFGAQVPLCTWQQLGWALLAALTVFCACWTRRAVRAGRFSPLLLAALYGAGVFTLSHRMHERYLLLAVVLLLGAAARFGAGGCWCWRRAFR